MKKVFSRLLSLLLIMALLLPLSISAFAAEDFKTTERPASSVKAPKRAVKPAVSNAIENNDSEDAKVLLIQDGLPWDSSANEVVLKKINVAYKKISTTQLGQEDLWNYSVVIIANDQSMSTYNAYREFKYQLDLFANLGGVIVYGACDEGWADGTLSVELPGGVKKINYYDYNNYIVDFNNPIVTGELSDGNKLTDDDLYNNYCSHIYFVEDSLPKQTSVILRSSVHNAPTLITYPYGNGTVIASGLTWEHAYEYQHGNFAIKAMDDLFLYALSVSTGITDSGKKMQIGTDNNKFGHNSDSFFAPGEEKQYYINDKYFDKLNSFYEEDEWESLPLTKNTIQKNRVSEWHGSCFGISTSMALVYTKAVDLSNFIPRQNEYYNNVLPKNNSEFRSLINYYQLSQYVPIIDKKEVNAFASDPEDYQKELKTIVKLAKQSELTGTPFIFTMGYRWKENGESASSGHAIVCVGCKETADGFRLQFVDPNNVKGYIYANVSSDYSTIAFESKYTADAQLADRGRNNWRLTRVGHDTLSIFSTIDIDGAKNVVAKNQAKNAEQAKADSNMNLIIFSSKSKFHLTTNNGKTLSFDGADLNGSLEVLDICYYDNDEATEWQIAVPENESYRIEADGDYLDISINNDDNYYAFTGKNGSTVQFNMTEGIAASGKKMNCDVFFGVNGVNTDMVRVSNTSTDQLLVKDNGNDLKVTGDNTNNCKITGFYNSKIYDIDPTISNGSIFINKNNDIKLNCKLSSHSIKVNYTFSDKLNTTVVCEDNDYTVTYESSDPKIVTVDNDGNVKGVKTGTATVTVTVTDSQGNTVTDTCTVKVKYTWWQILILIFLFGWLWY